MKKQLPFIILGVIVVIALLGVGFLAYKKIIKPPAKNVAEKPAETKKKKVNEPVNSIPQADRPYIYITPKDIHNLTITVDQLKKPAKAMDYELEYQTETNLEGAVDKLALDTLPAVSKDVLLGTCSAGGACRYHQSVKGGTLLGRFTGGDSNYNLKSDWKYILNSTREKTLTSKDMNFSITSPELAKQSIVIIYNSPGYPKDPGTVISEVYSLTPLGTLKGKATVSIKTKEAADSAEIMGWDGSAWKSFTTTVADQTAKAEVDLLPVYVVVKK